MAKQEPSDGQEDSFPVPRGTMADFYGVTPGQKKVQELSDRVDRLSDEFEKSREGGAAALKPAYSVKEAAQLLGRSQQTVRRWIREGKLESRKSSDAQQGHHLIPYASIEKHLRDG